MDIGCLDLGCISLSNDDKMPNLCTDSISSTAKNGKSKSPKDSPPSGANALNRVTSQIKKPPHRKTSPLNWFPRKKVDSYLNRKIKLLQEAGGMYDTLDETLGHTNPHYCRVEREKRAAREAACKVMEARKAAMVEASWCRILQAARIPNKEADAQLLKAEKEVAEAFEVAKSKGVIMYDTPDRPWKDFEIEVSSANVKGSTTHTIRASFETAFDVDKQVAAAVKTAFIRLARCHSFDKDEFKDLLKKISENPDSYEISESDDTLSEFGTGNFDDGSHSQKRNRKRRSPQKFKGTNLVNMMLERLKCLKEEELASLATIVATCGLNAALANSNASGIDNFINAKEKPVEPELPSLGKFLVKKMTKLEKEVLDAKNARKAESEREVNVKQHHKEVSVDSVPDLGSVLVKHHSKLEKEINEAKRSYKLSEIKQGKTRQLKEDTEVPSLDKFLVMHVSRLEKEVQEAKNKRNNEFHVVSEGGNLGQEEHQKENIDSNTASLQNAEKESLDKVLVKHVSKLEKAKMELKEVFEVKKRDKVPTQVDSSVGGLDQVLVKHKSRLEKERTTTLPSTQSEEKNTYSISRREAREREMMQAWGGIGLGNSMKPHVSRLEREKAAWIKAEEEEKQAVVDER